MHNIIIEQCSEFRVVHYNTVPRLVLSLSLPNQSSSVMNLFSVILNWKIMITIVGLLQIVLCG